MKTITIPAEGRGGDPFQGIVNGVKFIVPRGVEVSVPDEVAAVVETTLGVKIGADGNYPEDPRILPLVTAADNGKILRVVNGKWAVSDETVELPAVSADDDGSVLAVVDGTWDKYTVSGGE